MSSALPARTERIVAAFVSGYPEHVEGEGSDLVNFGNAVRARHALPAKCAPNSHTVLADAQAQVYGTPKDIDGAISLRACVDETWLEVMRRFTVLAVPVLSAKCLPGHSHLIAADTQAQV
jgi:hypothetical protein